MKKKKKEKVMELIVIRSDEPEEVIMEKYNKAIIFVYNLLKEMHKKELSKIGSQKIDAEQDKGNEEE
jgi:hypothetical protein